MLLSSIILALAIQAHDTPSKFHGVCELRAVVSTVSWAESNWRGPCVLEDMPGEGFNNRWRVVLKVTTPPIAVDLPPVSDLVKVQCSTDGGMKISSTLWGSYTILPNDAEIRSRFANAAPQFEIRLQTLFISMLNDHLLEVRVEEKAGVDAGWFDRFTASMTLLSHAK